MSMPTIPDLPVATTVADGDLVLVRQPGSSLGTDKQATVAKIRNLNIGGLSSPPLSPQNSDLMILDQGGTNYQVRWDQVSFASGTKMWFYQNTAPSGWTAITSGDAVLAVKGGLTYTVGGSTVGTWTQPDHTLTIDEIPTHNHFIDRLLEMTRIPPEPSTNSDRGGGANTTTRRTINTEDSGGDQPHNHGSVWRPKASVGLICQKN